MKDLPHHIKKLNRQVIRSTHREELEDEAFDLSMPSPPEWERTERQKKKQAKARMRIERNARTPSPMTPEERNKKMQERVPVFDRNSAKPKSCRPSHKKSPPL